MKFDVNLKKTSFQNKLFYKKKKKNLAYFDLKAPPEIQKALPIHCHKFIC